MQHGLEIVTQERMKWWQTTQRWVEYQQRHGLLLNIHPSPLPLLGLIVNECSPLNVHILPTYKMQGGGGRGVNWKWGPFPFKMPWRMSTKFVFLNVFILEETIYPKRWAKTFAKERKKSTLLTQSKRLYLSSLKIVRIQSKQSYGDNLPHAYDLYDQNRTTNAQ